MNKPLKIFLWTMGIAGTIVGVSYLVKKYVINKIPKMKFDCNGILVFVGDSTTEAPQSYADRIKSSCPQMQMVKIAKSGIKTQAMFDQFESYMQPLATEANNFQPIGPKPHVVFILGGINDIYSGTDLETTKTNIYKIAGLAHNAGASVITVTIPPSGYNPNYSPAMQRKTDELNKWLLDNKFAGNPFSDYVMDFYDILNDKSKPGYPKSNLIESDMQHPNASAHELLAQEFFKLIH